MTDLDLADRLDRARQCLWTPTVCRHWLNLELANIAREIRERGITPAPRRVLDPPLKEIVKR